MSASAVEALLDAVEASDSEPAVSFDGLVVEHSETGYTVRTPGGQEQVGSQDELQDLFEQRRSFITNWFYWTHVVETTDDARRSFLRRLEGATEHDVQDRYERLENDGITTKWGQLSIHARIDETGLRSYDIRHEDDAGEDVDQLDSYDDPLDARQLTKHDARGRYRPLKTAPSLVEGWHFPDLGPQACVDTVEYIYPATIANWYREQEGELDVTHYRECAHRQTGIYDMIEELDPDAVDWVAQACCEDSQCLKRREWEYDENDELEADGGDGVFPCREPCSLVVAAARKWTTLESETPRTYEFELTPSEKNQLEELIEAVADGRIDDIREADVYEGANRYRARYLRAKRFDEDGNFCGVPTTED
jgi:hypothetical protein